MMPPLDPALLARSKALSDQLDAEGVAFGDQVAICGSVLVAAALLLPPAERRRHLKAHLEAMALLLDALGQAPPC